VPFLERSLDGVSEVRSSRLDREGFLRDKEGSPWRIEVRKDHGGG
tara:strand:- start:788 stop:922 length:135 start_codon:yes stop_codon:yes gene_type:complete